MKSTLVKEFTLDGISLEDFFNYFWLDSSFTTKFLVEQLSDINVTIDEWDDMKLESDPDDTPNIVSCKKRQIVSFHPSKISFPGLPSHAESIKLQTVYMTNLNLLSQSQENYFDDNQRIIINETNNFKGIPYSDYFSVNLEWIVLNSVNHTTKSRCCLVSIYVDFIFYKSTWLQGTIESNTKAELDSVYTLWIQSANDYIKANHVPRTMPSSTVLSSPSAKHVEIEYTEAIVEEDEEIEMTTDIESNSNPVLLQRHKSSMRRTNRGSIGAQSSSDMFSFHTYSSSNSDKQSEGEASQSEDDNLLFYDCEEGSLINDLKLRRNSMMYSHSRSRNNSISFHEQNHSDQPQESTATMSIHDLSVTTVETTFVFMEYTFWKIYNFYHSDLRQLFDILPGDVLMRFLSSLLPGRHAALLVKPDLYGPLISLFLLPQAILLTMQAGHLGCSHFLLLCNALIVSLSLWLTLSLLYRIVAYVLAPTISFKQCLCFSGYSLFSWSLALSLSFLLEISDNYVIIPSSWKIPASLPLIIIGLPAAIAQGCLFWEYTPFSTASMLRSVPLPLPGRCRGLCSPVWKKVLWIVPKFVVFVLISGTHYEFLWYIAHTFVPGKKLSCRLSALLQPGHYTDVLTQKELLKYTLLLLKGEKLPPIS